MIELSRLILHLFQGRPPEDIITSLCVFEVYNQTIPREDMLRRDDRHSKGHIATTNLGRYILMYEINNNLQK